MSLLNKIVAYWYDCIKNEDILEKDISINVRKKAVLYPFNKDLLIFDKKEHEIPVFNSKRIVDFYNYIYTKGYESYYGYPILFYFDDDSSRYSIAPLFIIKVTVLVIRQSGHHFIEPQFKGGLCHIQSGKRIVHTVFFSLAQYFNHGNC